MSTFRSGQIASFISAAFLFGSTLVAVLAYAGVVVDPYPYFEGDDVIAKGMSLYFHDCLGGVAPVNVLFCGLVKVSPIVFASFFWAVP